MNVLIDTNIILDIALVRLPSYDDSDQVFSFIEQGQINGYVCASTFSDLYYLIRKQRGRDWALNFLTQLSSICQVATVNQATISMALATNFKDFEDAILYAAAVINNLDAIVTRNQKDFPVTTPRILTPEQLIQDLTSP
ncbi:putative nucleic acid-binding protein, contains PIN domain [Rivularia sp. PCC 7116]|uniref:PIN domain-containing protein n=1 Tax=Rivularia sp. PCC 7116 TaxID=373994 RepID=UPI00029F24FD|nr:PIN domain-containing protein [Rivularia sp. PCC 7116]AFY55483.1 putative nucleic acid-binding protein, contains PIN domain [Rivularia sp. PCC 7116]